MAEAPFRFPNPTSYAGGFGGFGGSVSNTQSSLPSVTGRAAVRVVNVRFLLGENHTYSLGASACLDRSGSASISGPDVPLSLRSSLR